MTNSIFSVEKGYSIKIGHTRAKIPVYKYKYKYQQNLFRQM